MMSNYKTDNSTNINLQNIRVLTLIYKTYYSIHQFIKQIIVHMSIYKMDHSTDINLQNRLK